MACAKVTGCDLAGGVRSLSILTKMSCRRCRRRALVTSQRSFPTSSFDSLSTNTASKTLCRGNSDVRRCGVFSCFKHVGCALVSQCLFRTGFETSTSSHFCTSGH